MNALDYCGRRSKVGVIILVISQESLQIYKLDFPPNWLWFFNQNKAGSQWTEVQWRILDQNGFSLAGT